MAIHLHSVKKSCKLCLSKGYLGRIFPCFWLLKTAHRAVEAIQMEVFVLPPLLPVGVSIASQLHNSRWNLHSHEPWQILGLASLASSKEYHCSKKRCWNEIYIDSQWFRSSCQTVPILATNSYDVTVCHSTCPLDPFSILIRAPHPCRCRLRKENSNGQA